jgi:squalene cyclase
MKKILLPLLLTVVCAGPVSAQTKESDPVVQRVNRALKFLKTSQSADGSWALPQGSSPAATSLAVMAFLSAGHVPGEGPYGDTITKGIRWVLKTQRPDGTFSAAAGVGNNFFMYDQGICALMLAEVTGMTDRDLSPQVKSALTKAVRIILQAQRSQGLSAGGWRYQITGDDADVSVTGWQLLALRAARDVGCDVPAERITRAVEYLKRCQDPRTGGFSYQPSGEMTIACTGTAVLCLELCDRHHSPEALRAGALLLTQTPSKFDRHLFYSSYYCSQASFQLGGNYWNTYRARLLRGLGSLQQLNGSWGDNEGFGSNYGTAMGVLALTVEYRLLPIYQRGEDQGSSRDGR